MKLINIGFGNIVFANRLIAIVSPESAPVKRLVQDARDRGMLIDATYGRRTRAVLITDSDHVILSAVQPETVANRLNTQESEHMQSVADHDDYSLASQNGRDIDDAEAADGQTDDIIDKKSKPFKNGSKSDADMPGKRRSS